MAPETNPTPTPEPSSAVPVAAPSPAPEPSAEQIETHARAWLKDKHGIEDPDELPRLRHRARLADQYEQTLQQQTRVRPQAPPDADPDAITREEWAELEQLGRINPVAAYARIEAKRERQRQRQIYGLAQQQSAQTIAMIQATQAYRDQYTDADRHVRTEYPEAFDKRSKLNAEAARVWDSMPWLGNTGDGVKIATQIAAGNLGILPKSKRPRPSESDDTTDQAPERGTSRPRAAESDSAPPTAREKRIAQQMGIDAKAFKKRRQEIGEQVAKGGR